MLSTHLAKGISTDYTAQNCDANICLYETYPKYCINNNYHFVSIFLSVKYNLNVGSYKRDKHDNHGGK